MYFWAAYLYTNRLIIIIHTFMEMQDPGTEARKELDAQNLNDAPAAAAGAGIDPAAVEAAPVAADTDPQQDAEAEAEVIMTDGVENEEAKEEAREMTAKSLLADALLLLEKDAAEISTDDIRRLRQHFSMLHKPEEAAPEGEQAETTEIVADPVHARFEATIDALKAKKAEFTAAQEAARAANLEKKNSIIAQIVALAQDTDNVNRTFPRYRELQDEFNAVGDVDPTEETGVWKRFQEAREQYSDNLKINKELRDYDFKKNLAEKEELLEEARQLSAEEDVIAAYRRLQDLHNKWRQIGPVAKELRDEIWNNFRAASAEVNKRYQAYFEARKAQESENETAKTALCERIEALDFSQLKTFNSWEEMTRTIQGLQEEWRKLGFASKKMNRTLFTRFRQSCDSFFAAKADFYRRTREELAANLAHKQQLVEQAEALKDSTDWREATDRFVAMQKEWKSIGAIPKKYSDDLWKRFTTACDAFFDAKKKAGAGTRSVEAANLRAKREIIGLLSAIVEEIPDKETAIAELRKLQDRWKEVGHVPFREKDKLYEAYRSAVDAVRNHFAIADRRDRRERFEANVARLEGDDNKLFRERDRLVRALEGRRNDLRTYENNLGFLSSKSKSGNSLMQDLQRRIDTLKADIAELEEKISLLDAKIEG